MIEEIEKEKPKLTKWFHFMDMSSGGGSKTAFEHVLIQAANESDAAAIFEQRLERDPYNVTCDCCGADYSINEYDTLDAATAYNRRCHTGNPVALDEYLQRKDVLVLREKPEGSCGA